jgi:hypothetical protein
MRRLASFRGNLLGAALAVGTPSPAESLVEVSPNPALLGPNGELSFEVSVTVKEAGGEAIKGDEVALSFEADGMPVQAGELSVSPAPSPSPVTNSQGEADFKVSCVEGYCLAGTSIVVIATDETAHVKLGSKTEEIVSAEVATANGSNTGYTGETATVRLKGVTPSQKVSLRFEGSHSPVTLAGECETNAGGDLSQFGEVACTFSVPPGSVGSTVPVEIKLGEQPYTSISFKLIAAPSLTLLPATGRAGTAIEVKGEGFPRDENLPITFTAARASAATASVTCLTNGLGEIVLEEIDNEITGQPCRLTVPEGTVKGEATVAVSGYPTAIANFNVTVSCATEPSQPGCSLEGISIDSSNLVHSDEIYIGATTAVTIDIDYSDGSSGPLTPTGGATPTVSWSTEPQPSGAIGLNGVSDGNKIGLTANTATSSPGVLQAEYDGFKATSDSLSAVHKPCDDCTFVNGALLNVKAQVPEGLGSKPLAGAIADIIQGVGSAPVFTLPPPCIPENGTCSGTYPDLEESATETCTTLGGGECQLIAGEGTEGVATEVKDTITLTAPTGYSVTGVSGCHEVTSLPEAPVCHLELGELSNPVTITFELKPWPELTVSVGAPEAKSTLGTGDLHWYNEGVDGVVATITPIEGTPGKSVTCEVEGGEETDVVGGKQAHCTRALVPGTYEVSVGLKLALKYENVYVTSEDPKIVKLGLGADETVSFNTASEYPLSSVASGESTESSTPAEANDGPLTATASGGTGSVTVGRYESDPVGVPTFYSSGQYIDVFLAQGSTFTSLTFTDCEMGGGNLVFWWNPKADNGHGEWSIVSDETEPSGSPPCVTVTINEETSPTLKQMAGTVFGVAVPPTSDTGGGGSSTPPASSATPTTTTPPATTAATGSVSLDGSTIAVKSGGKAQVKLTCTGAATCAGKLTLKTKMTGKTTTNGKGKGKKQAKTETIGTAAFSIPAGKTAAVTLVLNAAGRALLKTAHGHLGATLTILKSSPSPMQTTNDTVQLAQQKTTKAKKSNKK